MLIKARAPWNCQASVAVPGIPPRGPASPHPPAPAFPRPGRADDDVVEDPRRGSRLVRLVIEERDVPGSAQALRRPARGCSRASCCRKEGVGHRRRRSRCPLLARRRPSSPATPPGGSVDVEGQIESMLRAETRRFPFAGSTSIELQWKHVDHPATARPLHPEGEAGGYVDVQNGSKALVSRRCVSRYGSVLVELDDASQSRDSSVSSRGVGSRRPAGGRESPTRSTPGSRPGRTVRRSAHCFSIAQLVLVERRHRRRGIGRPPGTKPMELERERGRRLRVPWPSG